VPSQGRAAPGAPDPQEQLEHLRKLLRDLIDYDVGQLPEVDQLEGSHQIEQHNLAWERALNEVGSRTPHRYSGNKP
jgi:hypothetical protein